MKRTRILQYTHRPNATELGMGNTHETYMLVNSDYDISKIFPIGVEVEVEDTETHTIYNLKSASGREFRVNQMGEIYRDHDVHPGDEIVITNVSKGGPSKSYLTVKKFNRVVLIVGNNGTEIANLDRLNDFRIGEIFEVSTYDRGQQNKLHISFKVSKKKRNDSPNFTDFYNAEINGTPLANGTYYLTLDFKPSIVTLVKSCYNEILFEDDLINSATIDCPDTSQVTSANSPYRSYIAAIKSKPFLLLAGISGTGKSRIVRELARACWKIDSAEYKAQKPRNFEMVQVKPNWHDSSELIGYVSRISGEKFIVGPFLKFIVKAMQEPDVPYFLCLDEMNLAPVEQYFAEYLSVIESRKKQENCVSTDPIIDYEETDAYKSLIDQLFIDNDEERKAYLTKDGGKRLTIPQNLIVVGTVNMDETTFSFSRKVLDRAMTIEMNKVDLFGGLTNKYEQIGNIGKEELIGNAVEGVDVYDSYKDVCDKAITYLEAVNSKLEGTPFKVAYRTRNEFLLYVVNNLPYNKDVDGEDLPQEFVIARALDEITNMKILSRIEGDETKVSDDFLKSISDTIKSGLEDIYEGAFADDSDKKINSVSLAKIEEMRKRLSSGYTSFWS